MNRYDAGKSGISPTVWEMETAKEALLEAVERAADVHGVAVELEDKPLLRELLDARKKLRPALEAFEAELDRIERMVSPEGVGHGS